MLTDLSKGPKIVSSRNQGLLSVLVPTPQDALAPHFSGQCLEEVSALAHWCGGGAALLSLSLHSFYPGVVAPKEGFCFPGL